MKGLSSISGQELTEKKVNQINSLSAEFERLMI
jgi:hypothetical protein